MKIILQLLFTVLLIGTVLPSYGQDKATIISGTILDENESPLPGVTITIKGTSKGIISDVNGSFKLDVMNTDVLVFSSIGNETQEITVGTQTTLSVTMKPSLEQLEEVVVIGYGTQKRKDITGAISSVAAKEITSSGLGTVENALLGKVAGVVVSATDNAPGAGLDIKIRGTNSINASSAPLYVIDGFPIEGELDAGAQGESTAQSPLSSIDPNDIESIDILKDASATAIYGARGGNGVIIITTKSGTGERANLSFSMQHGVQEMIRKYDINNSAQYAKLRHHRFFPYAARMDSVSMDDPNYKWWDYETLAADTTDTDWVDAITRMGKTQNYNLSLSGGNQTANYLASVGYYKNEGILKNTDFERYTANFKVTSSPTDWAMLSFNTRFAYTRNNGAVTTNSQGTAQGAGVLQQAFRASPMKDIDSSSANDDEEDETVEDGIIGNPLHNLEYLDMLRTGIQSTSNASINLTPAKGLKITILGGLNYVTNDLKYFAPTNTSWGQLANGLGRINDHKRYSWLNENTISYSIDVANDHSFSVLAGYTIQTDNRASTYMEASNFSESVQQLGYNNMQAGEIFSAPISYAEDYALMSYLSRFNYSFRDKYLLTATFRADGSSKFAENKKWGYFPSLAVGWKIHNEKFLRNSGIFNELKLRAGWGETGNPNIKPYQSIADYATTKYNYGTTPVTGIYPTRTSNANLRWETSVQSNVGIDIALKKLPISISVDAYQKLTNDLLLNADIPSSMGFSSYLYNSGQVENKGLEVMVNVTPIHKKFKWDIGFNIAFNRNKILDLGDLNSAAWIDVPNTRSYSTAILSEGDMIGLWYGYETDGLWQQSDFTWNGTEYELKSLGEDEDGNLIYPAASANVQPGQWKYKDTNGDGQITADDRTIIGRSQPLHSGGLNNSFQYKGFDLSVFLDWSYGREVYNANNRFAIEKNISLNVDYWLPIQYELDENGMETDVVLDPGNPNGRYPGLSAGDPYGETHDGYMEDGSYIRIRNISLGYTFNKEFLKKLRMSNLRIYTNVANVHTFTNYSGYDPNINSNNMGGLRPGFDLGSYPLSRTYMIGLNANF
ncbi:SusC/RagA family TonB-linked outer membrane protein [Flammeovirga pacifica]|uniref:TonB-dependent receptor plug domain-containing protein n=1 Tax=Flammeovirga pacifica TaxID=915059 RepID=A0A1S1YRZ6_FLAPC|nr:TonB-dependent receptor [Flammeovirga pacifica]OHX63802.1 hypothetical protein NH26_24725 [Flammeovirga pacifica]